jgi:hypothetical protein
MQSKSSVRLKADLVPLGFRVSVVDQGELDAARSERLDRRQRVGEQLDLSVAFFTVGCHHLPREAVWPWAMKPA